MARLRSRWTKERVCWAPTRTTVCQLLRRQVASQQHHMLEAVWQRPLACRHLMFPSSSTTNSSDQKDAGASASANPGLVTRGDDPDEVARASGPFYSTRHLSINCPVSPARQALRFLCLLGAVEDASWPRDLVAPYPAVTRTKLTRGPSQGHGLFTNSKIFDGLSTVSRSWLAFAPYSVPAPSQRGCHHFQLAGFGPPCHSCHS